MRQFKSQSRLNKIISVLSMRQFDLQLILEEIHDPHNVSAILRTCDAVGVQNVSLVYNVNKFPKVSRISSASAKKWVDILRFSSIEDCVNHYHQNGYKVIATAITKNSFDIYQVDFTDKVAIILGNEHFGVTQKALELSDACISIPMKGMVQSLNVSVAASVVLYEAYRQRMNAGMYQKSKIEKSELDKMIDLWCEK